MHKQTIDTFRIEIETLEPSPDRLRVKLIQAPDNEGESETYWPMNPIQKKYLSDTDLGFALYECIFGKGGTGEIGQRFSRYHATVCKNASVHQVCLRLLLKFSSVKKRTEPIASLPWELLYDGSHWLARDPCLSIVRSTATTMTNKPKADVSHHLLLVCSEPQNLRRFGAEDFLNEISSVIDDIGWINHETLVHANRKNFKEKIARGYHTIHFIGHGETKASSNTGLEANLFFENLKYPNIADPISASEFADWIAQVPIKPQLIILTACQSANVGEFPGLGMAQALLDTGVTAVVAMQARLPIKEAKKFNSAFYRKLAKHATIDDALHAGRNELDRIDASSIQTGAEGLLYRLLLPNALNLRLKDNEALKENDGRGNSQESKKVTSVKFPAWALPILLLNGDSRLGNEPPPLIIHWKLPDSDLSSEMVYIPEGEFYIDKYPVIYSMYELFAKDWQPPNWMKEDTHDNYSNFPVTNVSVEKAKAFAEWSGRRLPTTEQWQQAALSGISDKSRRYPWGNDYQLNSNTRESKLKRPMAVQTEAHEYIDNTNARGMTGIIGNVAEFALDNNGFVSLCGGSYYTKGPDISIQHPFPAPDNPKSPQNGFRCIATWHDVKHAQEKKFMPRILKDSIRGKENEQSQKPHFTE